MLIYSKYSALFCIISYKNIFKNKNLNIIFNQVSKHNLDYSSKKVCTKKIQNTKIFVIPKKNKCVQTNVNGLHLH